MKSLKSSFDVLEIIQPEIWENYRDIKGNINIIKFIQEVDWSLYPNIDLSRLLYMFETLPHAIRKDTVATASLLTAIDICTEKIIEESHEKKAIQ